MHAECTILRFDRAEQIGSDQIQPAGRSVHVYEMEMQISIWTNSLKGNLDAHGTWNQGTRHGFLNRKLGPPTRAVSRHEDGRIKAFQISHSTLDLHFVAHGKMEATNHGVKWYIVSDEFECVLGRVDDAGVATASEDN